MSGASVQTDARRRSDVGVLVVDDQPAFRSAVSELIQFTPGFRLVGQVGSGEEAIEFVNQHAPGLVILDVCMPNLDGVATARAIARIRHATVTVLVSVDPHADIAADPRAHGAAAFIPKEKLRPAHAGRTLGHPRYLCCSSR
jgi:two-component system, NarL family, invasion response regulator UvrY